MKPAGRIYDVSLTLAPGVVLWPGHPVPIFPALKCLADGGTSNVSVMILGSHTGTHVDAPRHFLPDGTTLERLPLEHFLGPARVFALPGLAVVTKEAIAGLPISPGDIILFKTDNSQKVTRPFEPDYVYFSPEAAEYLAALPVRTVGTDYLNVDPPGVYAAHRALLGRGVVIIEGLNLSEVEPGDYFLSALPLRIENGNGSPVRAVLIEGV